MSRPLTEIGQNRNLCGSYRAYVAAICCVVLRIRMLSNDKEEILRGRLNKAKDLSFVIRQRAVQRDEIGFG